MISSLRTASSPLALTALVAASLLLVACPPNGGTGDGEGDGPTVPKDAVVIRPQTSQLSPFAQVEIFLTTDGRSVTGLRVEPETAVIYADPADSRLLSQVQWVLRCEEGGTSAACPDSIARTLIRPKDGCSTELFGFEQLAIQGTHNSITSGEPDLAAVEKLRQAFRAALAAQTRATTSPTQMDPKQTPQEATAEEHAERPTDCDGRPLRPLPAGVDEHGGFRWLYDVTVELEGGESRTLDPEIWIESDEDA